LRASEERFRLLADSAPALIWVNGPEGVEFVNRGYLDFFGVNPTDIRGYDWAQFIHPDDRDNYVNAYLGAVDRRAPFDAEFRFRRRDGEYRWMRSVGQPRVGLDDAFLGYAGISTDITERKQAEEQQRLLLREMSHRVKNLFAVTSGLVTLSARSARSPQAMAAAVRARLQALSRAHELTRPGLTGTSEKAAEETTLHALIGTIFTPYVGERPNDRGGIVLAGQDLRLSGSAITNLALVLHELATNAAKYGSLSAAGGVVHLGCSIDHDRLLLTWKERGGPRVDGEPDSEGFGGLLTRAIVADQFGGQLSRRWEPDGLAVHLSVPLNALGGA
jgi:PAS domain S-box-containing protein